MSDKLSQLERLNKLLDEGRISESEYIDLKAEVLERPEEEKVAPPHSADSHRQVGTTLIPAQRKTPALYKFAFGFGIVSVFLGGTFGLLAWATVAIGAWALYSEDKHARRWMAWTGLALGIVFSFTNAYLNGHLDGLFTEPSTAATSTQPVETQADPTLNATMVEGMSAQDFINNWELLISVIDSPADWAPEETVISTEDTPRYLIPALTPGSLALFLDELGDVNRVTLSVLDIRVSEAGYQGRIEQLLFGWQILCFALEDSSDECAQEVAEGLGYSFETLRNWNQFQNPIPPGTGSEDHYTKHFRNGLHWQIAIAYNAVHLSVGLEPLG